MRSILILAAAGAAAVLALAPGQDRGGGAATDTLSPQVLSRVEQLEVRVESLEAIAARSSIAMAERIGQPANGDAPPAGKAGPAESPRRIMQLDGVETADPDPSASPELERLRNEVESLERTVDQSERRASSSRGSSGGGGGYRSYGSEVSRQGRAEGEMFAKYKTQLREKQGELKRLERELAEPRQIIFGNWEGKIITLQTTRDLSRALDRIQSQDYLTWEGRRVSEDESSQEWVVSSIQRTDAPPGH